MKTFKIPIFTEEYHIHIFIGTQQELLKPVMKYTGEDMEYVRKRIKDARGMAWNTLPDRCPLIIVDGSLPASQALATLAHEACHAMDYITEFLEIDDRSGEFRAHGVSAVMRKINKHYNLK